MSNDDKITQNQEYDSGKNKRRIIITLILLLLFIAAGIFSYVTYEAETKKYENINDEYKSLLGSDDLSLNDIMTLKTNVKQLDAKKYSKEKKKLNKNVSELELYYRFKEELNEVYQNGVMKSSVTTNSINTFNKKYSKLKGEHKENLNLVVNDMKSQRKSIDNYEKLIDTLYTDNTKTAFRDDLTKEEILDAKNKLKTIKQTDIVRKYTAVLKSAENYLDEKEKQDEEVKEANANGTSLTENGISLDNSWKMINVNYISANRNGVLNGSVTASLLMALQSKGYSLDKDLKNISDSIPKNINANQGFSYDIYNVEPVNAPHWIATYPLTKFAINYSRNTNIADLTGRSLDKLNEEVVNGNPVVIYLTSGLSNPENMVDGIARNVSIMLLAGYNVETGEEYLIDPITRADGGYTYTVSKSSLESIYNSLGKRAVVIR